MHNRLDSALNRMVSPGKCRMHWLSRDERCAPLIEKTSDNGNAPEKPETAIPALPGGEKRQLSAIMEIANAINSRLDLETILSMISREMTKIIDYDVGCVAIYEKDQSCLYIRHVYRKDGDKHGEGRYVPLDESNLVGWVAINRKPILRYDIPSDTRFTEIMREDNLMSDMVVPLIARDSLVGTLNIGSYEKNKFNEFDLDLIEKFSQLTSIALENSHLMEDLKDLGEKYQMIMRSATDMILLLDISGEIVECNEAITRLFGYSMAELIGRPVTDFTLASRREDARNSIGRALRGERIQRIELPYIKKDGSLLYIDAECTIIKIKEHPYLLVICHDVTEKRALQEKITIQNEELKNNNKKLVELDCLKSEFLGRVSHELRTPLSIIMAYTGTLLEDGGEKIDVETRNSFLDVIDTQSKKLLDLINDLLDLSKVDISETMLNVTESSINELIRISSAQVIPYARRKDVEIKMLVDEGLPIVRIDPMRIRQVCVNLLTNAVKFTPRGGTVLITSARSGPEVVISVNDNGPGIDPKDIEGIFDNFTQVDGGAARSNDGMGIGLRLVKHYIKLHHGRVWVKSEKGMGSTFYFSLPLKSCADNLGLIPG